MGPGEGAWLPSRGTREAKAECGEAVGPGAHAFTRGHGGGLWGSWAKARLLSGA